MVHLDIAFAGLRVQRIERWLRAFTGHVLYVGKGQSIKTVGMGALPLPMLVRTA